MPDTLISRGKGIISQDLVTQNLFRRDADASP